MYAWGMSALFPLLAVTGAVVHPVHYQIPVQFVGKWHQSGVECNVDDDERYEIRSNEIIEYEVDSAIRLLRVKGNQLWVTVDEGYEPDWRRRKIHFVVSTDGKAMSVNGKKYHRCT